MITCGWRERYVHGHGPYVSTWAWPVVRQCDYDEDIHRDGENDNDDNDMYMGMARPYQHGHGP